MPLEPDDIAAIGKLLDDRLTAYDQRQRSRRRWWLWFWIILFIVSTLLSMVAARQLVEAVMSKMSTAMDRIDAEARDMEQAKLAYQQQLAHDQQMQKERAEVAKAAHYHSEASQADYEAGLIKQVFQLVNRTTKAQAKLKEVQPGDDIDADLKAMQEVGGVATDSMMALMQVLLRNTDPEHNTPQERLAAGEGGAAQPSPVERLLDALQADDGRPAAKPAAKPKRAAPAAKPSTDPAPAQAPVPAADQQP